MPSYLHTGLMLYRAYRHQALVLNFFFGLNCPYARFQMISKASSESWPGARPRLALILNGSSGPSSVRETCFRPVFSFSFSHAEPTSARPAMILQLGALSVFFGIGTKAMGTSRVNVRSSPVNEPSSFRFTYPIIAIYLPPVADGTAHSVSEDVRRKAADGVSDQSMLERCCHGILGRLANAFMLTKWMG